MSKYYLDKLESEAIFVLREVWAMFQNHVILFSGGKDSIVATHLARKAFFPSKIPLALIHADKVHNFTEPIKFRGNLIESLEVRIIAGSVQESKYQGSVANA